MNRFRTTTAPLPPELAAAWNDLLYSPGTDGPDAATLERLARAIERVSPGHPFGGALRAAAATRKAEIPDALPPVAHVQPPEPLPSQPTHLTDHSSEGHYIFDEDVRRFLQMILALRDEPPVVFRIA